MIQDKNNIKIGDKIRIITNTSAHHFEIGEIVKVKGFDNVDSIIAENSDSHWWWIGYDEFELIKI